MVFVHADEENSPSEIEEIHSGQWRDNLPNGWGVREYSNGEVYRGGFRDGMREGGGELRTRSDASGNWILESDSDVLFRGIWSQDEFVTPS